MFCEGPLDGRRLVDGRPGTSASVLRRPLRRSTFGRRAPWDVRECFAKAPRTVDVWSTGALGRLRVFCEGPLDGRRLVDGRPGTSASVLRRPLRRSTFGRRAPLGRPRVFCEGPLVGRHLVDARPGTSASVLRRPLRRSTFGRRTPWDVRGCLRRPLRRSTADGQGAENECPEAGRQDDQSQDSLGGPKVFVPALAATCVEPKSCNFWLHARGGKGREKRPGTTQAVLRLVVLTTSLRTLFLPLGHK